MLNKNSNLRTTWKKTWIDPKKTLIMFISGQKKYPKNHEYETRNSNFHWKHGIWKVFPGILRNFYNILRISQPIICFDPPPPVRYFLFKNKGVHSGSFWHGIGTFPINLDISAKLIWISGLPWDFHCYFTNLFSVYYQSGVNAVSTQQRMRFGSPTVAQKVAQCEGN